MKAWLINKNLCMFYILRKLIGKIMASKIAIFIEKVIWRLT